MSREGALLVMVGVVVVLMALGVWAWRRRTKRDAAPLAAIGEFPAGTTELAVFDTLYVATTRHDLPLERIAAPGLAFRSRADVTVTDAGVALDLTGLPRMLIPAGRISGVDQQAVAIDRVVEQGGLTRIAWRALTDELVDTYLRPQGASAKALADAIRPLASTGAGA